MTRSLRFLLESLYNSMQKQLQPFFLIFTAPTYRQLAGDNRPTWHGANYQSPKHLRRLYNEQRVYRPSSSEIYAPYAGKFLLDCTSFFFVKGCPDFMVLKMAIINHNHFCAYVQFVCVCWFVCVFMKHFLIIL